jgi:hypothetical protein
MTYTPQKPQTAPRAEELRARIPGWGADLDPADRPAVPRERFDPGATGAHWEFPERQPETWPRERSIEHGTMPPVFGTSCPPKGLSGAVRKLAYRRYSEGRLAHWLLLIAADRVDAAEQRMRSYASTRPDNLLTETGVLSEFKRHGLSSRLGQQRADVVHHPMDPLVVAGPAIARGIVALLVLRRVSRRVRSRSARAG